MKKMKDKAFAKGVSREDVTLGAQELGVDLEQHTQFVIGAMRGVADRARPGWNARESARTRGLTGRGAGPLTLSSDPWELVDCAINVQPRRSVNESGHRPRLDDRCDHNRAAVRHVASS